MGLILFDRADVDYSFVTVGTSIPQHSGVPNDFATRWLQVCIVCSVCIVYVCASVCGVLCVVCVLVCVCMCVYEVVCVCVYCV